MSFRLAAPSLQFRPLEAVEYMQGKSYPLNTALSVRNLLKSAMSLSMVSRICICRISVQTSSASDKVAVLSSIAPFAVLNL